MNLRTEIKRILNEYLSGTKISELPTGSALTGSELLECVQGGINIKITSSQLTGGGIPVTEFVQLTDVPSSYTGFGGYKVKVKADETGLEFVVDSGGGGGSVNSVNTGSGITIDNTDPANPIVNLGGAINQDVEIYPNVDGNFGVFFGVNAGGTSYASTAVIASRSFSSMGYTDGSGNFGDINFSTSGITITAGGTSDNVVIYPPTIFGDTVTLNADPTNPLEAATKQYVDSMAGGGYTFSSPLSESAGTVSIQDAAADGTTKGAATFTANDFSSSSGVISIDYTNGQAANGTTKGFLTSTDWTTFNNKLSGNQTITLSGEATGSGTTGITVTLTNSAVIGKVLTGYTSGAGTVAATDTILQAIQKLNGNIAAAISGAWSLASGGTFTGVNTITSNAASQLIFTGAYTTTANSQYYLNFNPTITARGTSSDDIYGLSITPSIVYGANNQTGTAIFVNVTTTPGAFSGLNSNFALFQAAGTTVYEINANGTIFFGSASSNRPRIAISNTAGSASVSGITLRVGGAWTNADSCAVFVTTGNTTFTSTGTFSGRMMEIAFPSFSPSSGAYSPSGLVFSGSISPSGTYTGTLRVIDVNLTGTRSVGGPHYGIIVRNTDLINVFGASSGANALVVLGAGTTTLAPLKFTSGTNLTTPVNGCIEYNGTNFFATRTGAVREGILTQSAVTTEVITSDTSITVNINGTTYKLLARA